MQVQRTIRPLLAAGVGVLFLSGMDATMKIVSSRYPIGEVVALRYVAGATFALSLYLASGRRLPDWTTARRNFSRAIIVVLTAGCFFTAIARLPLAEAVALTFLAPLLLSVLGRLILKEPVSPSTGVGIGLGLIGVLVIASDQHVGTGRSFDPIGVGAALGCAFFYALSNVLMRKQSGVDSVITIVALSNGFCLLLTAPVLALQWEAPSRDHALAFLLAGLLGTLGQLCLAWAYGRAHAGRLGVLEYTAFIWASLLGFFIFAEVPSLHTVIGAALIVAACGVSTWGGIRTKRREAAVEAPR